MLPSGICDYNVRLGGFGPIYDKYLTTCFNDVVLVPIPTVLLILVGIPIFLFVLRRPNQGLATYKTSRRCSLTNTIAVLYYILVLALLLMLILEITRDALSHSGVGLVPISLAGTLIVMVMLFLRKRSFRSHKGTAGILFVYWLLITGFQASKIATLHHIEKLQAAQGNKGPSKYPNSDKSLDNYVIMGLYAVFLLYEAVQLTRRTPRTADVFEEHGSEPIVQKERNEVY